jgi:membrane-associated protease RseP (regulator of RpoE activity)
MSNQENVTYDFRKSTIPKKHSVGFHITLFLITLVTTLIAGMFWTTGSAGPYDIQDFSKGLPYALSILFILTCHEFGHYFAAKYHKIDVTLPYYIPFPPLPFFLNFGTMGAVIRTRQVVGNNKAMFDIGVSGPIAGFIASLIVLIYGFTHLPGIEYILNIHPDYLTTEYGKNAISFEFGDTLLFAALRNLLTNPDQFVPPMNEIYHYPYLCVGWFGLFITAMNMIPVGQLDGGHIIYSMFGEKIQEAVSGISLIALSLLGFIGLLDSILEIGLDFGWSGWLFWALILFFIIKIKHPPVYDFRKLDNFRMILGYVSIIILLLSFSPAPFIASL